MPKLQQLTVRGVVVLTLCLGSCILAVIDKDFRQTFGNIVEFGLGAYSGQMIPK